MNTLYNHRLDVTSNGRLSTKRIYKNAKIGSNAHVGGAKFGLIEFSNAEGTECTSYQKEATRIIYIKAGSELSIDFNGFQTSQDELYFLRPDQYLHLGTNSSGSILFYNKRLYLADLEDQELLYGGILFNSETNNVCLKHDPDLAKNILSFFELIKNEICHSQFNKESMVRSLIKQIIIHSARAWRNQHGRQSITFPIEPDFSRLFDNLVEQHYKAHHTVAAYAKILHITPKALTKRLVKCGKCNPSDVIRKRIVLEAKRMLVHTPYNVKEIAYQLGYEDPCYFIRFFTKQVEMAPQTFRKHFQSGLISVA